MNTINPVELFASPERVRIMKTVLFREDKFGVNEVARVASVSKSLVSQFFDTLVENALMKRYARKYILIQSHHLKSIRIFLTLSQLNLSFLKKFKHITGAGIYGSAVKGTNTESSDIDLWITMKEDHNAMAISTEIKNNIANAKTIFLTKEKTQQLKKEDPLFYYALTFGSIVIYGDENALYSS